MWMGQVIDGLIKQNISQASACNDANNDPKQNVFGVFGRHWRRVRVPKGRATQGHYGYSKTDDDPKNIGQRIPAQRKFGTKDRD